MKGLKNMAAAFSNSRNKSPQPGPAPRHPNAVDCKRIEKSLASRARYRYVTPRVIAVENGYWIVSPCCSRNIDKTGGEIDIALIEFIPAEGAWRLYYRDHEAQFWLPFGEYPTLHALLTPLLEDSPRRFWQ